MFWKPLPELADIVLAMNFSYFLFPTRAAMLDYFRNVYDGLTDDGIFFLDAYGGYDAPREIEEERECDGFTYIWQQASFNPIDSMMDCCIHYRIPRRLAHRQGVHVPLAVVDPA